MAGSSSSRIRPAADVDFDITGYPDLIERM